MPDNLTPAERFERELEDGHLIGDIFEQQDHWRAFHRTIIDHLASIGVTGIEGQLMIVQAEFICGMIDVATRVESF